MMETNKVTRQSRSDDSGPHGKKNGSNPRQNQTNPSQATAQKRQRATDGSNERHKLSSSNVNDAASHSGDRRSATNVGNPGTRGGSSGTGQRKIKEPVSGEGTPQEAPGPYALGGGHPASQGASQANCGVSESGAMQASQSTAGGVAQSNGGAFHLSTKSDTNANSFGGSIIYSGHGNAQQTANRGGGGRAGKDAYGGGSGEPKKKRKNSDKAQRRASNNRRAADKEDRAGGGQMFPPTDPQGSGSHPRSHSRGTVSQQSQGNVGQAAAKDMTPQHNPMHSQNQYQQQYDPHHYNPFAQNHGGFPMGMNGMIGNGFPFGQGGGPFMGGGQQAPQVHFIAKKQQFIAQISPEQLMNGDKRPYTAQALHNLSANAKRAGSVYANAMSGTQKHGQGSYNMGNAAFTSHPSVYLGSASKTHTQGFSFHPTGPGAGLHKYSNSLYGEDVKPKVAGKDILHALGSSNGFSSGYNSDPYHSMMSQGLPASLTHSTRPTKAKANQNRMHAKEKEQLYDETLKMKVLNNQVKEDNVKLKTKVKILENELGRKEKTIEDLFTHNQLIQQSHQKHQSGSNQSLLPLAQTAQKYQQETFLVMSLKKQIRELKYEVLKRDEELEVLRKNIKSTRTKEFEQEIQTYHDECLRLRSIMEEVIKQGANHPIHQQNYMERLNQMQSEIQHKDQQLLQLSDCLDSHLKMEKAMSGHTATTGVTGTATSLAAVKAQDSQHFDSAPSDIQVASSSSAWTQNHQGRDKSVDKKQATAQPGSGPAKDAKDYQKELNKTRKLLREKDKELAKVKAENGHMKRESQEKTKNESQVSKDAESTVKTLKDRVKDQKGELKRREERLGDSEQKIKKLEEQLKSQLEAIKGQEDSNKQLKAQLRQAKHTKQAVGAKAEAKNNKDIKEETSLETKPDTSPQTVSKQISSAVEPTKPKPPHAEIALLTLVAQREKLCRDDLTAMMLAGEESLRMLIRRPSDQLIDFIKANLEDEDAILSAIPRFEMPKTDFETQVLREMRVVLRENAEKIAAKPKEECMKWEDFEILYAGLDNFEYPHKDKLLEFIKYFFLDHILSEKEVYLNFAALQDHLLSRRPPGATPGASAEKSRNESGLRSRRRSNESGGSYSASAEEAVKRRILAGGSEEDKFHEEERMLDVAEQCFMRIADLLHLHEKTVKQVFLKYSQPEQFKDGSVLELISPRGFLEGVREVGFEDVTELEAACLMKVLSKPELDNAVILNEFVLIMENFGIPPFSEEEEFENDYVPDSDDEKVEEKEKDADKKELAKETTVKEEEDKDESKGELNELSDKLKKFGEAAKAKQRPLVIKFDILDDKAQEILKNLARFLLERYMHPREFFGPTIKKEVFGKKKCKVEIIKLQDFYLRLKLASIRKNLTENSSLGVFLAIDGDKHPGFVHVKKMIKALEAIAEGEQEAMIKEQEAKEKEDREAAEIEIKEREEKGLPPVTIEELIAKKKQEKEEEKEVEEAKKKKEKEEAEALVNGRPPKGPGNEMMKLGGKSSPKGAAKPETAAKFNSLKPNVQLNTIEEDLHETQTSHYSYQIKDGEGSERDGSRHHLSTSNHLRDSNNLNIVEAESSRKSGKNKLSHGQSVQSGDYSGGSNSGSKKGLRIQKDIEAQDVSIKGFREVERTNSEMMNKSERLNPGQDSLRKGSIAELDQKFESDPTEAELKGSRTHKVKQDKTGTKSLIEKAPQGATGLTENYTDDEEQYEDEFQSSAAKIASSMKRSPVKDMSQILEMDDKLQDQLDEEVDKKFLTQMESSKKQQLLEDEEQYDEDEFQDEADNLKEDTIKTDKIEQIIEDDLKEQENQQRQQQLNNKIVNIMEDEYDQHVDQQIMDPEEYSYHDEETYSQQAATPKKEAVPTKKMPPTESDIEEDYEF